MNRGFAIALAIICCLAAFAQGETYKVGPDKDYKDLSEVADKLKAGDVVDVDPAYYRDTVVLRRSGTRDKPITIRTALNNTTTPLDP